MFRPRAFFPVAFFLLAHAGAQEPQLSPMPSVAPVPSPEEQPTPPGDTPPGPEPSATPKPRPKSDVSVEIDLTEQKAYLIHGGHKVYESPISSGRYGHLTPTGDFEITQKDLDHRSSLYGKIVERESGRVVVSGADAAMSVPHGCEFVQAPMKNFMRFDGAVGMHAGILPGHAASHGCVRLPGSKAKLFYNSVEIGSRVHVFGKTPVRQSSPDSPSNRKSRVERAEEVPVATPAPRRGWWPFSR